MVLLVKLLIHYHSITTIQTLYYSNFSCSSQAFVSLGFSFFFLFLPFFSISLYFSTHSSLLSLCPSSIVIEIYCLWSRKIIRFHSLVLTSLVLTCPVLMMSQAAAESWPMMQGWTFVVSQHFFLSIWFFSLVHTNIMYRIGDTIILVFHLFCAKTEQQYLFPEIITLHRPCFHMEALLCCLLTNNKPTN